MLPSRPITWSVFSHVSTTCLLGCVSRLVMSVSSNFNEKDQQVPRGCFSSCSLALHFSNPFETSQISPSIRAFVPRKSHFLCHQKIVYEVESRRKRKKKKKNETQEPNVIFLSFPYHLFETLEFARFIARRVHFRAERTEGQKKACTG